MELRYGVWNPTSFHLTDEYESGNLAKLLIQLGDFKTASQLAEITDVPRGECEALLDHLVELGVVEDAPTTALDHYIDHIIPALKSAPTDGLMRPILLLGDPVLMAEIERHLTATSSLLDVRTNCDQNLSSIIKGRREPHLLDGLAFQELVASLEHLAGHFLVYAATWINPLALQALNRVALELRIPWMHAVVDGPFLFIGPIFLPPDGPCYECFETRVTMNLRDSASYLRYKQALATGRVNHSAIRLEPVLSAMLAAHTAHEILNFSLTGTSFTARKVLSIYLPTMEFAFHEVLRVPGCAACSSIAERDGTELYFDMRTLAGA